MKKIKAKGFTLVEVLAAVLLLSACIVPVMLFAADNLEISRKTEQKIQSTLLAEAEMEKIKNTLRNSFSTNYSAWSADLGNNYVAERTSTVVSATLKTVEVSVGYDINSNGSLDAAEIMVTLTTRIVERN